MENVEGKTAFITGGASGIGLGIAKAFVNAGMKVVLADIRQDHIDEALGFFADAGNRSVVHALHLDVTDREAYAAAADEAERVFGNVHVLINNAGMGIGGPVKLSRYADWDWGLDVLLGGVVNGLQTFLPRMIAHGEGGHICTTSSMSGLLPIQRSTIYTTAKAAVIGLSETIRGELADDGIEVSVFCPGPVQTNIRESGRTRPEKYKADSGFAEVEKQLEQRPNSPLWMTIEEVGERVLRGIRNNDLYILTHREFKEGVAERFQAILNSFPDEPYNHERAEGIAFLIHNDIFTDELEKQSERAR